MDVAADVAVVEPLDAGTAGIERLDQRDLFLSIAGHYHCNGSLQSVDGFGLPKL